MCVARLRVVLSLSLTDTTKTCEADVTDISCFRDDARFSEALMALIEVSNAIAGIAGIG